MGGRVGYGWGGLLGLVWMGAAWAGTCPPLPEPVAVEFQHFSADPVIDNSRSQAWIQAQPGGNPRTRAQTESHLQTNINLNFAYRPDPESGQTCVYLTHARFKVAFDALRVFIADRFPPGSCAYGALHAHELEHVALSRATLERLAPQIEKVLTGAARGVQPLLAKDRQVASQAIGTRLQGLLAGQKRLLEAQHGQAQRAIDTPQSYADLQKQCPTWEE